MPWQNDDQAERAAAETLHRSDHLGILLLCACGCGEHIINFFNRPTPAAFKRNAADDFEDGYEIGWMDLIEPVVPRDSDAEDCASLYSDTLTSVQEAQMV